MNNYIDELFKILEEQAKNITRTCAKWDRNKINGINHNRSSSDYSSGFQNTVHEIASNGLITEEQAQKIWDIMDN